jgi:hypothetical protein
MTMTTVFFIIVCTATLVTIFYFFPMMVYYNFNVVAKLEEIRRCIIDVESELQILNKQRSEE